MEINSTRTDNIMEGIQILQVGPPTCDRKYFSIEKHRIVQALHNLTFFYHTFRIWSFLNQHQYTEASLLVNCVALLQ